MDFSLRTNLNFWNLYSPSAGTMIIRPLYQGRMNHTRLLHDKGSCNKYIVMSRPRPPEACRGMLCRFESLSLPIISLEDRRSHLVGTLSSWLVPDQSHKCKCRKPNSQLLINPSLGLTFWCNLHYFGKLADSDLAFHDSPVFLSWATFEVELKEIMRVR